MNNVQSPNARLLCDHCHGHGYEDTAAGKVACGERNPAVECDHEWEFQDDSFSHEYGTEQVHYWRCELCEATRNVEPGDFEFDD